MRGGRPPENDLSVMFDAQASKRPSGDKSYCPDPSGYLQSDTAR
jgi:hypothetical protein